MQQRLRVEDWATDWDYLSPEYHEHAPDIWKDLRERCPFARTDRFQGAYLAIRYDDVTAIAHETAGFSSRDPNLFDEPPERRVEMPPITLDPPSHAAHRRVMLPAFSPRAVQRLIPATEATCHALIDGFVDTATVDAGRDYAAHVPVSVTAALLGLPAEDGSRFRGWVHDIVESVHDLERNIAATREALAYFRQKLAERRERGGDDVMALLARGETDSGPIPERTQAAMLLLLLLGGIDTTWSAVGSALLHLATHPEDQSRLRADPGLLDTAVEEFLRLYAPAEIGRVATADADIAGRRISAGEHVWLSFPAANRDPEVFADADRFVIDRRLNRHVAFGVGIHRCIGSNLARMELRVALDVWMRRLPPFRLADDAVIEWTEGGNVRGPRTIPVVF
jgi:cytochrome P450